jgi:protein gp37
MATKIEWCEETWNPFIGCKKVSPGCANCYAERMAVRLAAMGHERYEKVITNGRWNGQAYFVESEWDKPYRWRRPRLIFVGSMGDTFLTDEVPYNLLFKAIWQNPRHRFIILTKRPKRMEYVMHWWMKSNDDHPPNLWLGVSAENLDTLMERVPWLKGTAAAKRVVSYEPALEGISEVNWYTVLLAGLGIDWLICGCESGPGARPFDEDWARTARDACQECGVPFFYKQGPPYKRRGQPTKMPKLDGKVWAERPEW